MGFASGFSSGYTPFAQAAQMEEQRKQRELENKWRQAQEDRAAKEFEQRQQDQANIRGLRMQLDDQLAGRNPTAEGGSQYMGPPQENFQPATDPSLADPRKTLGLRMRLASAQGQDLTPYTAEQNKYKTDDIFSTRGKAWMSMDPAAKAEWIRGHNMNSDIPMYGTLEKNGKYTMFVQGRPSVQLSDAEMQHLYIAEGLMDHDPQGALKILQSGSDKIRALAKDLMATQAQVAQVNNAGAHYASVDANQAAHLGLARDNAKLGRMGAPVQMLDANKNPVLVTPVQQRDGTVQYVPSSLPAGLQFPKQQLNPAERARAVAEMTAAGVPPETQAQILGDDDPNAALVKMLQQANEQAGKKQPKPKAAPAQPPLNPAAPPGGRQTPGRGLARLPWEDPQAQY